MKRLGLLVLSLLVSPACTKFKTPVTDAGSDALAGEHRGEGGTAAVGGGTAGVGGAPIDAGGQDGGAGAQGGTGGAGGASGTDGGSATCPVSCAAGAYCDNGTCRSRVTEFTLQDTGARPRNIVG